MPTPAHLRRGRRGNHIAAVFFIVCYLRVKGSNDDEYDQRSGHDDVNLDRLREAAVRSGAPWSPQITRMSELSPEQARKRLGFVPRPGTLGVVERERRGAAKLARPLIAAAPPISIPLKFNWRDKGGADFVTPVRDQGECGSCVAFGALAVMEAQIRISDGTPNAEVDLSEAHLFYCLGAKQGRTCGGDFGGWWPDAALEALRVTGAVDEACFPYTAGDQPCDPCADWKTRLRAISAFTEIAEASAMKEWLSEKGPLLTTAAIYADFFYYGPRSGIYTYVDGEFRGGHCLCVVGYDDVRGCWSVKNSWGVDAWGDGGFGDIAYGQIGVDDTMYGMVL